VGEKIIIKLVENSSDGYRATAITSHEECLKISPKT